MQASRLPELAGALNEASLEYSQALKRELAEHLRVPDQKRIVELLNLNAPHSSSFSVPMPSLLEQALVDMLPGLEADSLSLLVVSMAHSGIRYVTVWNALAKASRLPGAGDLTPRHLAELVWGFAQVRYSWSELSSALQSHMKGVKDEATAQERGVFCWACANMGQSCSDIFGNASANVPEEVARRVWAQLHRLSDRHPRVEMVSKGPAPVALLTNALWPEECEALIQIADGERLWEDSTIQGNQAHYASDQVRTSATATLNQPKHDQDPVIEKIRTWAAALLGVPTKYLEPLQLVRYMCGQRYKRHADWRGAGSNFLWILGQHVATILVYLNTLPKGCGGETCFDELGLRNAPQRGAALVWLNVDANGLPHQRVWHEAQPVLCNESVKYALNIWVGGQEYPDRSWIGFR